MATDVSDSNHYFSSIELISLTGFSLCMGWVYLSFFWIFCDFPPNVPIEVRDFSQLAVFLGIAAGYLVLYFLSRNREFNIFTPYVIAIAFVFAILQPLSALGLFNEIIIQFPLVCVAGFLSGVGAAVLIVGWLDVLSRLKRTSYNRFCGLSFLFGMILFLLAVVVPANMQPLFAMLYALASIGLLLHSTKYADGNDVRADLESVTDPWSFTKEIEPSFFVFNIVFAMNFVFLFNNGRDYVLFGLIAVIPSALIVALLGIFRKSFSVITMQRIILVLTVFGCVLTPFSEGPLQLFFACVVSCAWGAFMATNYAFIVRKSTVWRDAPLFRQAPPRLFVAAFGFAVGWAISSSLTFIYGTHSGPFTILHLAMTVILVFVIMLFFPKESHHPASGKAGALEDIPSTVVSIQMNESELFDKRCEAIVKLYQLSPREADILEYLAKGRNAAWIQEQLLISPHTVKSHIYNIYLKLDIHSQQKLMSFVEEFPLDV